MVRPLLSRPTSLLATSLLVLLVMTLSEADEHHKKVRIHVPYKIITLHHHHVKKIPIYHYYEEHHHKEPYHPKESYHHEEEEHPWD